MCTIKNVKIHLLPVHFIAQRKSSFSEARRNFLSDLLISDNASARVCERDERDRERKERETKRIFWLSMRKNVLFGGFKEAVAS